MDDHEMNRIIAEKVMGLYRKWGDDRFGEWHNENNICMYRSNIHGHQDKPVYSPATDVAQAFEALAVWKKRSITNSWGLSSIHPLHGRGYIISLIGDSIPGYRACGASGERLSLVVTEALVKAVSDD